MKLGKCLKRALAAIDKDSSLRLVQGPPGQKGDTSHFWTIDRDGNVYDPTPEAVGSDYKYDGRIVDHKEVRKELEETKMDVSKFREELRARLEGQYNSARKGMGLPEDEFEMEEDASQIMGQIANYKKRKATLDKKLADLQQKLAKEQGKNPDEMNMDQQSFQDDVEYIDEGDEDISAAQGKNLLKFASADKIAAAIMNMDDMELANFIENGLKQAGVQEIADNMETAGGGEPVDAEPEADVDMPGGAETLGAPEDETGGQEGNMKLADL